MNRTYSAALAALLSVSAAIPGAVWAQQTGHRHLNPAEKHPTLTGVAAAGATHHALKVSARHKKRSGQHLNFAERHPTLSAIGAGVTTHHLLKKSAHKKGH